MGAIGRWFLRCVLLLRSNLWLRWLWQLRQSPLRWGLAGIEPARRARLITAVRGAAGATGRIVALVAEALDTETQGTQRRTVLAAAVAAGVIWWLLVQAVVALLDRRRPPGSSDGRR